MFGIYELTYVLTPHQKNSRVEALIPSVMAFGGGAFRRYLALDDIMRVGPP